MKNKQKRIKSNINAMVNFVWFVVSFPKKMLGSETGKFSAVKLPSCDESANACVLKRNTNATIEVDFNLSEYLSPYS